MEVIHTIGRRKTSVARIYVYEGNGAITVNKKNYTEFFPTSDHNSLLRFFFRGIMLRFFQK